MFYPLAEGLPLPPGDDLFDTLPEGWSELPPKYGMVLSRLVWLGVPKEPRLPVSFRQSWNIMIGLCGC